MLFGEVMIRASGFSALGLSLFIILTPVPTHNFVALKVVQSREPGSPSWNEPS
jgi:hypothetical protein